MDRKELIQQFEEDLELKVKEMLDKGIHNPKVFLRMANEYGYYKGMKDGLNTAVTVVSNATNRIWDTMMHTSLIKNPFASVKETSEIQKQNFHGFLDGRDRSGGAGAGRGGRGGGRGGRSMNTFRNGFINRLPISFTFN